jgi:hypothetical protein
MCSTLQIGIKTAPAEVLTVSPLTGADPAFALIPFTPVHSAVHYGTKISCIRYLI